MKSKILSGIGMFAVVMMGTVAIAQSQRSLTLQKEAALPVEALIGKSKIQASDARFRPLASLVMQEASEAGELRGNKRAARRVFIKDWGKQWFNWRVYHVPGALSSDSPRPLTPAEAVQLETLFAQNLGRSDLNVTHEGITGKVGEKEAGMKFEELVKRSQRHAEQMSKFYSEASRSATRGRGE